MVDILGFTLAQSNQGTSSPPTPYLDVSQHMGSIVAVCVILIVVVAIVQKVRKKK